ncbi:Uncharacterized protein YpbB [Oceanobacillus limi]|uniref:Uncharacterized protein YpbB n=1 Tax=Oceanobacillus limi TaxID=930131 RepID=A0A1H9ZI44_9BACI|nr:helix-turn-helix domain-containing protein [Oceanobacillus limi]SES81266.1 Uncharacterized protein YpbB [Oceanobacillus limi]
MYLNGIILQSVASIKGQRTIYGIYHLLKGKKSIQTIHDSRIYQVEGFYGIAPTLNKADFEREIRKLESQELIIARNKGSEFFFLTHSGMQWIHQHDIPYTYYKGLTYSGVVDLFMERLMLLIQTYTNSKKSNLSFIPIVDNEETLNWVKMQYRRTKTNGIEILPILYEELYFILSQLKGHEAEMFVDRLTGYHTYGMSTHQLAEKYNMVEADVKVLMVGIIHFIMSNIEKSPEKFQLLRVLLQGVTRRNFITNSAKVTNDLLKKGYSIEKVAKVRRLKVNTIQDHIVEIALYNVDFPVEAYVDPETESEIIAAIRKTNSYKLRDIKEALDNQISYFQIRLVLSRNDVAIK